MRQEKPIIVNEIQETLDNSSFFFLVSYMGLSVKQQEELKSQLRDKEAYLQVQKNQLIKKAAEGKEYAEVAETDLTGGTAIVFGSGEPADSAKVIKEFAKKNDEVTFKLAFVDGQVLDAKSAALVAEMPTKDEARAMLLGLLNQVPTSLVRVLNEKVATIAYVLNAVIEKKK